MARVEWDAENETYAEFKKRRSKAHGISGMGQKKREGTGKINKSALREKALKPKVIIKTEILYLENYLASNKNFFITLKI